jgi:putative membrane protein
MTRISTFGFALALLTLAAGAAGADEQLSSSVAAASKAGWGLSPVDYNFVAQANLGAPFQIDSGRIAEKKATTGNIRDYAHLMVVTHIPVVEDLNTILRRKQIAPPPDTLLQGAYGAMISSLNADTGAALDRDYVEGQVEYQKGNDALFRYEVQYGSDPDLKSFAQRTLPKIDDHLQRALKLGKSEQIARASSH